MENRAAMLFALAMFAVLGAFCALWAVHLYRMGRRSRSWPTAPGEITSSSYEKHREDPDTAHVDYRYTVGPRTYSGDRVAFGFQFGFGAHLREARHVAAAYRKGRTVQVYYDPDDPSISVLENGPQATCLWDAALGAVIVVGSLIGIALLA